MIPKVIHYCWFGGGEKPALVKKCIKSWKKYCPDYEIIEWNEYNYDYRKNQYMLDAYRAKKWGFVPDYARLDIIYNHGGFYLDTDVELLKSLDDMRSYSFFVGIEESEKDEDNYYVALGLGFGAEKNNNVIKKLLDSYQKLQFKTEDGTFNLTPSPVLNTEVFCELGYGRTNEYYQLESVTIFPSEFFCPKSFHNGKYKKTKNTISIHHYAASWFTMEQQKQYRKKLKNIKIDYYIHTPNRVIRKLIGDKNYEIIKKYLK